MNPEEFVVVKTYSDVSIAGIAASRLGAEGIKAHIQKDDCGGAYPSLQKVRGVQLVVRVEDVENAQIILNDMALVESQKVDVEAHNEDRKTTKSGSRLVEVSLMKDLPSQ